MDGSSEDRTTRSARVAGAVAVSGFLFVVGRRLPERYRWIAVVGAPVAHEFVGAAIARRLTTLGL